MVLDKNPRIKMKDFKENNCRICKTVFCCKLCREKHENKQHNIFPGCDICINGKTLISSTNESVINHIKKCHWPLHCIYCQRLFGSVDELFQHIKCPLINKLPENKENTPYTPLFQSKDYDYSTPYFLEKKYKKSLKAELKVTSSLATSTPMQTECTEVLQKISEITPVDFLSEPKKKHLKDSSSVRLKRKVTFCETPITESFSKRSKNMTTLSTQGGSTYYTASEQGEDTPERVTNNIDLVNCIITESPISHLPTHEVTDSPNLLEKSHQDVDKESDVISNSENNEISKTENNESEINKILNTENDEIILHTANNEISKTKNNEILNTENNEISNTENNEISNTENNEMIIRKEETIWISAVNISATEICSLTPDISIPAENNFLTPMVPKGRKINVVSPIVTKKEGLIKKFTGHIQISSTPNSSIIPVKSAPNIKDIFSNSDQTPSTSNKSDLENWAVADNSIDAKEKISINKYAGSTSSINVSGRNNLWTSVSNMVKNVLHGISHSRDGVDISHVRSLKRHSSDTDAMATPAVKRFKLTDIKCRRNIREMTPLKKYLEACRRAKSRQYHVNIVNSITKTTTKTFADKATQTDEVDELVFIKE